MSVLKFIGFPTLRDMVDAAGPNTPRYFVAMEADKIPPRIVDRGLVTGKLTHHVMAQCLAPWDQDIVLYWRYTVGAVKIFDTEPYDTDAFDRLNRSTETCIESTREWLSNHGRIITHKGMISPQCHVVWSNGDLGDCLEFYPQTGIYRVRDTTPAIV